MQLSREKLINFSCFIFLCFLCVLCRQNGECTKKPLGISAKIFQGVITNDKNINTLKHNTFQS